VGWETTLAALTSAMIYKVVCNFYREVDYFEREFATRHSENEAAQRARDLFATCRGLPE